MDRRWEGRRPRASLARAAAGVVAQLGFEHAQRAGDEANRAVGVLAGAAATHVARPPLQVAPRAARRGAGGQLVDGGCKPVQTVDAWPRIAPRSRSEPASEGVSSRAIEHPSAPRTTITPASRLVSSVTSSRPDSGMPYSISYTPAAATDAWTPSPAPSPDRAGSGARETSRRRGARSTQAERASRRSGPAWGTRGRRANGSGGVNVGWAGPPFSAATSAVSRPAP